MLFGSICQLGHRGRIQSQSHMQASYSPSYHYKGKKALCPVNSLSLNKKSLVISPSKSEFYKPDFCLLHLQMKLLK